MTNLSRLLLTSASAMALVLAAPSVTRAADPVDGVNVTYAGTGAGSQPGGTNTTYTGTFDGSGVSIYQVGIATGDATDAMVLSGSGAVQDVQGNYSSGSGAALRLDGGSGTTAVFSGASGSYISASGTALSFTGSASSTLTLDDSIVSGATGIVMATPQAHITLRNTQVTGGIDLSSVTQHTDLAVDSASQVDSIGGANASLTLTLGAGAHGETGALNLSNVTGSGFISFSQQGSVWQYSGTITTSNSLVELSGGARAILANAGALGHTAINFLSGTVEFTQTGTYANNIIAPGTAALQSDTGVVTTLTGLITNAGTLNFTGPGTFDLTTMGTTSTWNGVTTLNGGATVKINAVNQLGGTQVNLGDASGGATLQLDGGLDYTRALTLGIGGTNTITGYGTLSGKLTGSGGLTFAGNNSLIYIPSTSTSNDYTGATTIGAGAIVVVQASQGFGTNRGVTLDGGTLEAVVLDKDIVLTADSTINHVGNGDAYYYGSITGNHALTFIRTGQFYTAYVNSAVTLGALTIADGVTVRTSGAASVTGLLTLNANSAFMDNGMPTGLQVGGLAGSGQLYVDKTLTLTNAGTGAVFSGTLQTYAASAVDLVIAGGTQVFDGIQFNTDGSTEVDTGATLEVRNYVNFGAATGGKFTLQAGGTLQLADNAQSVAPNLEGAGQVALGANSYLSLYNDDGVNPEFSGVIDGLSGSAISLDHGVQTLSGANPFAGQFGVNNGTTLYLSGAGSLAGTVGVAQAFGGFPVGTLDITSVTNGGAIGGLWGGGVVNLGSKTLTLTNAASDINDTNTWFSGTFNGTGNVTLMGGTQVLSGDSSATYSGATTVNSGATLIVANAGALGSGGLTTNNVTATGGLVLAGGTLDARADVNNAITVTADSVIENSDANHHIMGALNGDHALKFTGSQATAFYPSSGIFTGDVENAASAPLYLSVSTTGTLHADGGTTTWAIGRYGALAGTGTVNLWGDMYLTGSGTFDGTLTGTNDSVYLQSGASLTLTGVNTLNGLIHVSGSTLALSGAGSLGSSLGLEMSGGTFDISGLTGSGTSVQQIQSSSWDDRILLGGKTLTLDSVSNIDGVISGTGGVTIAPNSGFGSLTLSNANTYTGTTTIMDGAHLFLVDGGRVAGTVDTSTTGILDITGATSFARIGSLAGAGTVTLGSTALLVTAGNSSDVFSGDIGGAGNLAVTGGIMQLSSAISMTGNVIVNGGTLELTGSGSVASAASLQTAGSGIFDISGTTSGASITTLANQAAGGTVQLGSKTLTITAGSTEFDGMLFGTGGVTVAAGTQVLGGINAYSGVSTIADGATLKLVGSSFLSGGVDTSTSGTLDVSAITSGISIHGLIGSGSLVLGSKSLSVINGSGTFGGAISGDTASVVTLNGGNWTLSGDNSATYAGMTQVFSATLTVPNAAALGTGWLNMSSGTLNLDTDLANTIRSAGVSAIDNSDAAHTLSGRIDGSGTLQFTGSAATSLTGVGSFFGTLENASNATLTVSGNFQDSTLQADAGTMTDVTGPTLSTYLHGLTGSGTVNVSGGDLHLVSANSTFDGTIVGTNNHWLYIDQGSLTLTHADAVNGMVFMNGGTLALSGAGSLEHAYVVTDAGGTLDISAITAGGTSVQTFISASNDDRVLLGSKMLSISGFNAFYGVISGTGGVNFGGNISLHGASTYTGTTTIANGAHLQLTDDGALAGPVDTSTTGALDVGSGAAAARVGSLTGAGLVFLDSSLELANADGVFTGTIGGTGGLIVSGGGTQEFTHALFYTGLTVLNGGEISLHDGGTLADGTDLQLNDGNLYDRPTTAQTLGTVSGNGAGTLTLDGTDGGSLSVAAWTQTGGNISLTHGAQLTIGALSGYGAATVNSGTTLTAGDASDTATGFALVGSGTFIKAGTGTLTFNGNAGGFSGNFTVSAGTLKAVSSTTLSNPAVLTVASGATLDLELNGGAAAQPGQLAGSGTVTSSSANGSAVILSHSQTVSNAFTGGVGLAITANSNVTVATALNTTGLLSADAGSVLTLGANSSVGYLNSGGTIALGTNALTLTTGSNSAVFGGTLTGSGALTLSAGRQTMTGASTGYTGQAVIADGATLALSGSGGIAGGVDVKDGGTFDLSGTTGDTSIGTLVGEGARSRVLLSGYALNINGGSSVAGTISGTGGINVVGSLTLSAASTYSGVTQIGNNLVTFGDTLALTGAGSLANSTVSLADDATLDISGVSGSATQVGGLSGTFPGSIHLGAKTLEITGNGGILDGVVIDGTGGLKMIAGTQRLETANTYSGGTVMEGGTLYADAAGALGTGPVSLNGGTLVAGAAGILGTGTITLNGGTLGTTADLSNVIEVAADSGIDDLSGVTLSGALNGAHTLRFVGPNGATTTLNGGGNFSGTFSNQSQSISTTPTLLLQSSYDQAILDTALGATTGIGADISLKSITGRGFLVLDHTLTLTDAAGSFDGFTTGAGGLTIAAGSLTLSQGGNYSGVTEIDDGATLSLTATGSLRNSQILVKQGGIFDVSGASAATVNDLSGEAGSEVVLGSSGLQIRNAASTFAGVISGTGGLNIYGTETLSGTSTATGATTINPGATLVLTGTGSLAGSVQDYGTLDVSNATAASVGGVSSCCGGNGTILTGTSGVLALTDGGTYLGTLQGAGIIRQTAGQTILEDGVSSGFTGTLEADNGASLAFSTTAAADNADIVLKGSGALDISNAGADRQFASLSGESASTVDMGARNLTLGNASGTFAGVISGTGRLTIAGGTETFSGVNTYTGPTIVSTGATLALAGSGSIAASGGVGLQSGTLDISATDAGTAVQGLFFSGGTVVLGSKTLTINVTDDEEYLGLITGTGGLVVSGDANGNQEFTRQLDYTGGTMLNGGGIDLHSGGAFAAGSGLVLNGGAFFDYATTAQMLGTVSGNGAAYIVLDGIDGGSLSVVSWTQTGGTLSLSNGMHLTIGALSGNTAMDLDAGTVLSVGDAGNTIFSGDLAGSGSLTKQGSGTLTLAGGGNFSGDVTVSVGTLKLGADSALGTPVSLALSAGASLDLNGHVVSPPLLTGTGIITDTTGGGIVGIVTSRTIDAAFAGAAGLSVTGNSTVVLTAEANTTGALSVAGGSSVTLAGTSGSEAFGTLVGGGTVDAGANTLVLAGGQGSFTGSLTAAALTLTGDATQTLTSAPHLSGPVIIGTNAYLALGGTASLAGQVVKDNGTFDITGIGAASTSISALVGSGNVYLADKTLVITDGNGTFTGDIYGTTGIVDISGTNQVLAGNNSYGGTTLLRPGTILIVGSTTAFGTSVLDFQQGAGLKFGALSGTFANKAVLEGDAIFRLAGGTVTYAGAVTGAGTLTVLGTGGTVVLTNAANDYGGTLVQGNSTVRVNVAGALGKGAVTLGADGFRGTLQAGGNIALTNAITVKAGGGTIDTQGFDFTVSTIDGEGALTKAGSGTLVLTGADAAATTIAAGTLKVGDGGAITGNVTDDGALVFDSSTTYAGAISGSGSLGVTRGTLVLTGSAAQTGGTTIASGATLQLGTGGSIAGAITDNGTLAFSTSSVLNNAVSGSGSVSITSGTLQLGTGSIAATNGLTIGSGATFDLNGHSQTISALSGIGAVALGSGTLTANSGSFGGVIGGSGGLTITGNVTLSGTNSYTGATKVNAGVLTVTGSIAGSSVTVASGAALAAGGTVSNIAIQSGGTLAPVAGSVGNLAVSGDLILASGSSTIVDVTAAAADRISVSGTASIAGALNVNYLGGGFDVGQYTLISSTGTLRGTFDSLNLSSQLGNLATTLVYDAHDVYLKLANTFVAGQTFSLDSGIANVNGPQTVGGLSGTGGTLNTSGGTLTIDQSIDTTFSGTIAGSGPITKTGGGTLILDGNNSGYTGVTTINGGLFEIGDASHPGAVYAGSVTVGAGGTLGGHGTITGSVVNAGGTAPGGSIGTLTVLGNYGFASGATLLQEVAANGSADLLKVGGAVTIAGNTSVQVQPTYPVASYARVTNYTIVTGQGGVSGAFSSVTSSAASLTPILSYGPSAVSLTLVRNDISLATLANTANQAAVGGAISARPNTALFAAVAPLANAQLPAVFDSLSGEVHATMAGALLNDGRVLDDAIRARGAADEGLHVWGNGDYRSGSFDGSASAAAAGTHLSSFALGADTRVAEGLRFGAAAGVARNTLSIASRVSRGDVNSFYIGGYGGYETGAYGFGVAVTHGWNNIGTGRLATGQTETASYNAGTTTASGEMRYRADIGNNLLAEPFARLAAVWLSTDSFAETGGSAALSGTARDRSVLFSDVGARLSTSYLLGDTLLTPHASLAWEHASGDIAAIQSLSFGGGTAFNVTGAPLARDAAAVEAGIGATIGGWTLGVDYSGRAGNGASENGVRLRIGTTF